MGKFRKGDVVSFEATVESGHLIDGALQVRIEGTYVGTVFIEADRLQLVQPSIEVGDTVRSRTSGFAKYEVIAIAGADAWVRLKQHGRPDFFETWSIAPGSGVERVEPEAEPSPAISAEMPVEPQAPPSLANEVIALATADDSPAEIEF